MVNAQLLIPITVGPEPDPDNPIRAQIIMRIVPVWMVNGVPQECTDRALVIATLQRALEQQMAAVPWDPPKVIASPIALVPGAH